MERLYDEVKSSFDNSLKSNFESIVRQNQIPVSNEDFAENCYVTFFVSNQDLNVPKKKLSKYRQSHPKLQLNYSLERFPDFSETKNTIYSDLKNKTQSIATMKPMFLFGSELDAKWRNIILPRIHFWINTLFSQTLIVFEKKYSITLALLLLEVYVESPDNMFVTKLPTFEDLLFASSNRKTLIDGKDFINDFAKLIDESSFFQR